MIGLLKVVTHRTLPRTLHAGTPSRHVDWENSGLRLVRDTAAWPSSPGARRAGSECLRDQRDQRA